MKRIVSLFAAAAVVCCSVFTSCDPSKKADQKAEITSIKLLKADNPALGEDVTGKIEAATKTMSFTIPTRLTERKFIPAFSVSDGDVVKQDGAVITSGTTPITVETGKELVLEDELSAISITYKIQVVENDEKAELVSACFAAADNTLLKEDVTPEAISDNMLVRVPASAFQQTLTLSVTVGENDVVTVNGNATENGKINVDTAFPIDIVVKDEVAGSSSKYVLKVGKILGYVTEHLGTYTKAGATMYSEHNMEVNPADKLPYIVHPTIDEGQKYRQLNVIKWNGSAFETVGSSSFTGTTTNATIPGISFADNGSAYVLYKGGESSNIFSVRKLEGSEWNLVGNKAASLKMSSGSTPNFGAFIADNGNPKFFYTNNVSKTDPGYRSVMLASYNAGEWSNAQVSNLPAYGSKGTNGGMFYGYGSTRLNGVNYALMHFNEYGFYVVKVKDDNTVELVVENYVPEAQKCALPGNCVLTNDGEFLYALEASWTNNKMDIYQINPTTKEVKIVSNPIPVEIGSMGTISDAVSFAVSSDDKTIVVAREAAAGDATAIEYAISDENGQLSEFKQLDGKMFYGDVCVKYAGNNTFYVSYVSYEKPESTKIYSIELYRIGLEADIIPE